MAIEIEVGDIVLVPFHTHVRSEHWYTERKMRAFCNTEQEVLEVNGLSITLNTEPLTFWHKDLLKPTGKKAKKEEPWQE